MATTRCPVLTGTARDSSRNDDRRSTVIQFRTAAADDNTARQYLASGLADAESTRRRISKAEIAGTLVPCRESVLVCETRCDQAGPIRNGPVVTPKFVTITASRYLVLSIAQGLYWGVSWPRLSAHVLCAICGLLWAKAQGLGLRPLAQALTETRARDSNWPSSLISVIRMYVGRLSENGTAAAFTPYSGGRFRSVPSTTSSHCGALSNPGNRRLGTRFDDLSADIMHPRARKR